MDRAINRASRTTSWARCSLSRASHTGATPSRGDRLRKLSCCTAVLLCRRQGSSRVIRFPQQSVNDRPGVQQIDVGGDECRSTLSWPGVRYLL
jgi:hypothetical protein